MTTASGLVPSRAAIVLSSSFGQAPASERWLRGVRGFRRGPGVVIAGAAFRNGDNSVDHEVGRILVRLRAGGTDVLEREPEPAAHFLG